MMRLVGAGARMRRRESAGTQVRPGNPYPLAMEAGSDARRQSEDAFSTAQDEAELAKANPS